MKTSLHYLSPLRLAHVLFLREAIRQTPVYDPFAVKQAGWRVALEPQIKGLWFDGEVNTYHFEIEGPAEVGGIESKVIRSATYSFIREHRLLEYSADGAYRPNHVPLMSLDPILPYLFGVFREVLPSAELPEQSAGYLYQTKDESFHPPQVPGIRPAIRFSLDLSTTPVATVAAEGRIRFLRSKGEGAADCACCDGPHVFSRPVDFPAGQRPADLTDRIIQPEHEGLRMRCTIEILPDSAPGLDGVDIWNRSKVELAQDAAVGALVRAVQDLSQEEQIQVYAQTIAELQNRLAQGSY